MNGSPPLDYRVGTFATFRQQMLESLIETLPGWRPPGAGTADYATVLVELWAYVADVLTFYQERIANEAFLPTATGADSLRRLAELVRYRPLPGSAASTMLAFNLAKDTTVTIPARLRASSRAARGKPAVVFETDAAIAASDRRNAIPLASTAPANQFAAIEALAVLATATALTRPREMSAVFPRLAPVLLGDAFVAPSAPDQARPDPAPRSARQVVQAELRAISAVARTAPSTVVSGHATLSAATTDTMPNPGSGALGVRAVAFRGLNLGLRQGGFLLIVDSYDTDGVPTDNGRVREIVGVEEDRRAKTTSVSWLEDTAYVYRSADPAVYAFGVEASPFGHDAPAWLSLSPYLTQKTVAGHANTPAYPDNWDTPPNSFLPDAHDDPHEVLLDRGVDIAPHTPAAPSLAVLVDTDAAARPYQTFAVRSADRVSVARCTVSGKVSRLRLSAPIRTGVFARRTTLVLTQTRPLELFDLRALPERVTGARLVLAGTDSGLARGDQVVIQGRESLDPDGQPGDVVSETAVIDLATPDAASGTTTVILHSVLQHAYTRSTTQMLANVVSASHGETIRQEILGSGNGGPLQSFVLRKTPLTYLRAADADRGVRAALEVAVDGVLWQEVPTLFGAPPGARAYSLDQDGAGTSTVRFGDTSARPPAGSGNIRATYRRGLGSAGNLDPGAVVSLTDARPGLRSVTNAVVSAGGSDPETGDEIRANAPKSIRTLGRVVALGDYPAAATSFPGVAMARAEWQPADSGVGSRFVVRLTVAGPDRQILDPAAVTLLRRYLDARRDPNVPLRIVPYTPVYVTVTVTVDVDDNYGRNAAIQAVRQVLSPTRNPDGSSGYFARLGFGDAVHLSAVYAAAAAVPGIRHATVDTLRERSEPAGTIDDHILVLPNGLAVVDAGALTVQLGQGGVDDS
jgi:hypothetical protein